MAPDGSDAGARARSEIGRNSAQGHAQEGNEADFIASAVRMTRARTPDSPNALQYRR
jgi:hypothetical protein